MKIIDCKGLECPVPIVNVKKELETHGWATFKIILDDEISKENVSKLIRGKGYDFNITEENGLFNIVVHNIGETDKLNEEISIKQNITEGLVILISSDKLGSGDDKLGSILMKSYIFALSENEILPKTILFLNDGVKLTIKGSDVMESLKTLEAKGSEILSCGTCLDFYDLKEKLGIGSVTNMYTIVDKLNSANNTIKI